MNADQLQVAVAAAKRQFGLIRQRYPNLKAYLVLSLPGGQTGIDASPIHILSEFPGMVVDDGIKAGALGLLSRLSEAATDAETGPLKSQLEQLATKLSYDEHCQVELRFNDLNNELIRKLQVDDLIDRNLTPQTRASILIVLGTLARFEKTHIHAP